MPDLRSATSPCVAVVGLEYWPSNPRDAITHTTGRSRRAHTVRDVLPAVRRGRGRGPGVHHVQLQQDLPDRRRYEAVCTRCDRELVLYVHTLDDVYFISGVVFYFIFCLNLNIQACRPKIFRCFQPPFLLYGCMAVWLYGCMAVWLYGCMAVWLYGCMAVWLYGCMAVGCMAVWCVLPFENIVKCCGCWSNWSRCLAPWCASYCY